MTRHGKMIDVTWDRPALLAGLLLVGLALLWVPMAHCEVPYVNGCPSNITTSTDPGKRYATVEWLAPVIQNGTNTSTLAMATNYTPGDRFDIGVTLVVYALNDEALLVPANCSFFIQVKDDEDPVFLSCPSNITISLTTAKAGAVVTWEPTEISDNSGDYNLSSDHSSGDLFPIGDTVVHYTATDASSKTKTCEFVVNVIDLRTLEFNNCPKDITQILHSGQSKEVVTWQKPIVSLEGREVSITANHKPGELFDLGRTEVTYTVLDTFGSSAYCKFIVIVTGFPYNNFVSIEDSFLPGRDDRILLHSSVEGCLVACLKESSFVCRSVDFSTKDKCLLSRATAADLWGILAKNKGFTHYERLMEGTRPVLVGCPQNLSQPTEAGRAYATVSWREPTMSDGEPAVIVGTHSPKTRFYVGETKVVYTTSGGAQTNLSCNFFVIIKDQDPPIISNCPQNITKVTSDQEAVKASWVVPMATDNLGSPHQPSSDHRPGDWFPLGSTTVTYSARDKAGNWAECSFVILVKDIPDSHYILLHLTLQNVTYSDSLQDNNSVEFQKLASTIEKDVLNIFHGDGTVLGVEIDQFSFGMRDNVAADVKIGFSNPLSQEDRESKLRVILAATVNRILASVAEVKFKQDNGKFQSLDACSLSPCLATMNCRATGLQCTATCTDNEDFCLNGGQCSTNTQNLITCNCQSENNVLTYSGDRCELERMTLTGKQLTIISLGGVWATVMLGMLAMYCIALRCKSRGTQGKIEANIPLHVFADSPTEAPRGIRMATSVDLGYTSQGEDKLSPVESDNHIQIQVDDSKAESHLDQAEGRPRAGHGADDSTNDHRDDSTGPQDGILSAQDSKASPKKGSLSFHNRSSSGRSSSSCTFCKSSCSSASHSSDHQSPCCSSCTCDSGTEVVQFPNWGNSHGAPDGAAVTHTAAPRQMTVQVDVERSPFQGSAITYSYNRVIPEPLVGSDVPGDESVPRINNPCLQAPPLDPKETAPFLSHYFDGEIPDPIIVYDQSADDSAFPIETQPQVREIVSEQRSLSSYDTHSYEGTIPDPVLALDECSDKQSGVVAPIEFFNRASYSGQFINIPSILSLQETDDIVMTDVHFV